MSVYVEVRKNTYYDSVVLMLITKELKKMESVKEIIVGMGTELNKELAENLNLVSEKLSSISPSDFFVAVESDEVGILESVLKKVDLLLSKKDEGQRGENKARSLESAVKKLDGANLVVISIPGQYAADEAKKALENGLNVMLFSDNVSIEDEVMLKKLGRDKGLLVMGPDCGTAIINHVPLCFANVVRKGNIGIVGASGTGTQEVSVLIDRLGGGVTQVIGTGGRDLKSEVGGIMMIEGFKALADDINTKVIVLISKPPAPEVEKKILDMVKTCKKPIVVNFIGGDRAQIENSGAYSCITLEDAAHKAVSIDKGIEVVDFEEFEQPEEVAGIVKREVARMGKGQRYLRGLYTGGTLADEAMKLLGKAGHKVYSNIPLEAELKLADGHKSMQHTCVDLGEDEFTKGKPHPMIDPAGRVERLLREMEDEDIAVVLMDFVLGYGSNIDPAGEMIPSIIEAKKKFEKAGKYLCVIGYICGTAGDPQNLDEQSRKLIEAGVVLMPSNAQAVRLTLKILDEINAGKR